MNSKTNLRINLLIGIIILVGFITTSLVNFNTYSKIIKDDIENISKLTSTNIYSEINSELIKPIMVSLTMANDSFLKNWLKGEVISIDESAHLEELQEYLVGIKLKYDYNSVFLVSEETNNYYHFNGVHKKISTDNNHDQWYYTYKGNNLNYELDVDNDEADRETLTVFVNARIEDEERGFMGVTGVGLEMNEIQNTLIKFEEDFGVEAFLVDETGLIQVHTDSTKIENFNIFDIHSISLLKNQIINNKISLESNQYSERGMDGYLITRYIDELDWYLVIKKDTAVLRNSFRTQLLGDFLILIIVVSGVLLLTRCLIERFKGQVINMAKTDQLTQLPNRRGFDDMLSKAFQRYECEAEVFHLFILDIDNFKEINDSHGHIFGDCVIKSVGNLAKKVINEHGNVARWGGDEFVGIIHGETQEVENIVQEIINEIHLEKDFKDYSISVSIGMTKAQKIDTTDTIITRADKGLYIAKNKGKGRIENFI